jgi:hypothetical protein
MLIPSAPVTVTLDASIPTPTLVPSPSLEPTATPDVSFDQASNAYRVRFAPYGTWVELSAPLAANTSKRFVLSAMQGQVMSVSVLQGAAFTVTVTGADGKTLSNPDNPRPYWRGTLPAAQDYFVTINTQVGGPFMMRVAINPPGVESQFFDFIDPQYGVALGYTDEFAPVNSGMPFNNKGTPLLTLALIEPALFTPVTNLSETYLLLAASQDPAIVSACIQPVAGDGEKITGQVILNGYTFTRSEFSDAGAGNFYELIAYRTAWENTCYEVIFLIHSTNIGNYTPGTVVEFDHAALLDKLETVLNTFMVK